VNDETVKQWLIKADNDVKIAKDEMATAEPVTDMVCFHMQQCCEKYLKAFLIFNNQEYPRTHRIAHLIGLCANLDPAFEELAELGADRLTRFATAFRYGEEFYLPSQEETKAAIELGEKVREFVLGKLRERGFQP